jgi:hypothetical protein
VIAALKTLTALGLSLWMSALACLLGCGQIVASLRNPAPSAQVALAEMPDCHHHSSQPSGGNQRNSNALMCCLPDAISQKTFHADSHVTFTPLALPEIGLRTVQAADRSVERLPSQRLHSGRQTLLKLHILRI